jgi:hypothetical protein
MFRDNLKGKVRPKTGHEGPEGEKSYRFTLSLTSAQHRGGLLKTRPDSFIPGQETRNPFIGRSAKVRKISPPPASFVLCTSSELLLCPDCPGCAFCPYCTTHTTQTTMPPAGFEHVIPASDWPQTLPLDRLAQTVQRVSSRYTDYAIPIHLGVMMRPISCLEKSLANYQSFFLS